MAIDWNTALGTTAESLSKVQSFAAGTAGGESGAEQPAAKKQEAAKTSTPEEPSLNPENTDAETDGADDGNPPDDHESAGEEGAGKDTVPMSREERRDQVIRRRREELDRAVEKAKADMKAEMQEELAKQRDLIIAGMRVQNTYTGKLCRTQAEYDTFIAERDRRTVDSELERVGLERETFETMIENHPDIIRARELAEQAEQAAQQAEQAKVTATDRTAEQRAAEQLAIIQGFDPKIKSMEQLLKLESYDAIYSLVNKNGLSISDAYYLANRDAIEKKRTDAARQEAINSARSKDHMQSEQGEHGNGAITVPASVKRNFKAVYGNISDTEIQKKYERILAKTKKG